MTRDEALAQIGSFADVLRAFGVEGAYLFGSTGRNEASAKSDIDLFIDVNTGVKFSLIDFIGVKLLLEDALHVDVDVTTRAGLHPRLKE